MSHLDIGDLPTGFMAYADLSRIDLRQLYVKDLTLIDWGARTSSIQHIIEAIKSCCLQNIDQLTDGDFQFLCAWLRMHSYPTAPSQVSWTCHNNYITTKGLEPYVGAVPSASAMERLGLKHKHCGKKNVEIVHNNSVHILSLEETFEGLPKGTDFPRISTLPEAEALLAADPSARDIIKMARWVEKFDTIKKKIKWLESQKTLDLYMNIQKAMKVGEHGIYEKHPLWCRECDNRLVHKAEFNPFTFFADNKDKDIMDIQYTLLSEFGMQPDDDLPCKKLLYLYSCLAKDRQVAEEKRRLNEAVRSRG